MAAVIFAGPSVQAADLLAECDAEVLPPVRRGDIAQLMLRPQPPTHVGIVDGEFLQSMMISPKEIARVLENTGATFYGASSIGALRAVELENLGMVGVGRIFELYRDGIVWADDEVAMTFDPETMRPLSEPMVDIRLALSDGQAAGLISGTAANAALRVATRLSFADRTYRTVLRLVADTLPGPELQALADHLLGDPPNAKRQDAVGLARRITADRAGTGRQAAGLGTAAPARPGAVRS